MKFFSVTNKISKFNHGVFNEKANACVISWKTSKGNKIVLEVLFFENPHLENGITIKTESLKDTIGMLIKNYKPKLMLLPDIKTRKYDKLKKRLNKSEKKYHFVNIKQKNEKWYNHSGKLM